MNESSGEYSNNYDSVHDCPTAANREDSAIVPSETTNYMRNSGAFLYHPPGVPASMSGPTRRRLLAGVSAGSVFLSTGTPGQATADNRGETIDRERASGETAVETDAEAISTLDVTIVDTTDSVGAGDFLEVTAAIENSASSDVRTDVDLVVGDDFERVGRIRTTIEAGETTTVTQGVYTEPVLSDDELPVRVETEGGADERLIGVNAAQPVSARRPDTDLTVQSGSDVLFEVGAIDPDGSQQTVWWVDGEQVSGAVSGPWQATYAAKTGYDYWWHPFESNGTYEVAAAIVPEERTETSEERAETYAAFWTVAVTEDGTEPPSVDAQRPPLGDLSYAADEIATFELDVSAPSGQLDRVVWWLTQADVLLDVTELTGEADTARLSVEADRLCQTCQVVPWIVAADGTVAGPDGWQIGPRDGEETEHSDETGGGS